MTADSQGNDLEAVGVPLTGMAAFAPVASANVIAKAELAASPLVLPVAAKRLGLYKVDGGPAPSRENGDAMMIVLWETEAQARRALPEYGAAFLKALAAIAAISTGTRNPISVWEVNARV